MTNEQIYLDLLRDVYENGTDRPDRTGVGTRSVFARQSRYDLSAGFPMLTTKKMDLKPILSELLWFLEGSGDERRLAEIRYGKDRSQIVGKNTIWTANQKDWKNASFDGDLGRVYGIQWRKWQTPVVDKVTGGISIKTTDQVSNLIDGIKNDPFSRRHIISAWNPGELADMALPPCHVMVQFYIDGGKLSCHFNMRSSDYFLGAPFNISSYAMLTHMLAQICGYKVGELIYTMGDIHLYLDHLDSVKEQLKRKPRSSPFLYIDPTIKKIDEFTMDSFEIMGYDPHPAIKAKMAV